MNDSFWQAAYIIAALCVVLSIKWLNSPVTARRGVRAGEFGISSRLSPVPPSARHSRI